MLLCNVGFFKAAVTTYSLYLSALTTIWYVMLQLPHSVDDQQVTLCVIKQRKGKWYICNIYSSVGKWVHMYRWSTSVCKNLTTGQWTTIDAAMPHSTICRWFLCPTVFCVQVASFINICLITYHLSYSSEGHWGSSSTTVSETKHGWLKSHLLSLCKRETQKSWGQT